MLVYPSSAVAASYDVTPTIRSWQLHLLPLEGVVIASLLFTRAVVRLRARGRAGDCGIGRIGLFAAAMAAALVATCSPLDPVGDDYLLSAHMLQHVVLADVVPALTLLALRGPLIVFFVPAELLRRLAHRPRLRRIGGQLTSVEGALAVWVLAFGLWHIPAVYDFALRHETVHSGEHASFVLAGSIVWWALIDPLRRRRLPAGQRMLLAAGVLVAGSALSLWLMLEARVVYPAYADPPARLFSLAPLADQHAAGLVMLFDQLLAFALCGCLVLRSPTRTSRTRSIRAAPVVAAAVAASLNAKAGDE